MPKDQIFESSIKYGGIFNFRDYYEFAFKWLRGEAGFTMQEDEYEEKLSGNEKEIKIKWKGTQKVSDYFHYEIALEMKVEELIEVEIVRGEEKVRTNKGKIKLKLKATFIKDPKGQFETTAKGKIWRSLYEKFLIPGRVKEYEDKLRDRCLDFLGESKAFLELEGQ